MFSGDDLYYKIFKKESLIKKEFFEFKILFLKISQYVAQLLKFIVVKK